MYLTVPPFPMNIMGSCWTSDWPHSKNLFLQLLTSLSNLLPECSFSQRWCCLHIATGKLILKCQQPQWTCRIISSVKFLIYEMLEPNGIIIFFERREIERFESKCFRGSPYSWQWKPVYPWYEFPHTMSSVPFSHRLKQEFITCRHPWSMGQL